MRKLLNTLIVLIVAFFTLAGSTYAGDYGKDDYKKDYDKKDDKKHEEHKDSKDRKDHKDYKYEDKSYSYDKKDDHKKDYDKKDDKKDYDKKDHRSFDWSFFQQLFSFFKSFKFEEGSHKYVSFWHG